MPASVVWIGLGCVLVILVSPSVDGILGLMGPRPFWGLSRAVLAPGWIRRRWLVRAAGVRAQPLVAGVEREERQPRRDAGAELDEQVDPDRRPGEQAGGGAAERDRRVEHAAGDAADGEGASRHGEPDRQPEEPVARLVLAGGHVEHHVAQGEGDQQFHHGGGRLGVTGQGQGLDRRGVDDGAGEHPGDHAADDLRDPVSDGITDPDPAADQRRHRHRRVVVAAGDVAAGVDHDHQRRARRQRGEHAAAEHAHPDDEGEEERPDRLDRVLPECVAHWGAAATATDFGWLVMTFAICFPP